MPRPPKRTYSRYTLEAIELMASQIRRVRIERKMSAQELADRMGVSRGFVQRLEKGDPKCEFGMVLEAASVLEIPLFSTSPEKTEAALDAHRSILPLLPKRVQAKPRVKDGF